MYILYFIYVFHIGISWYFDLGLPTQRHCRVWLCRCCCRLGRGDHRLHRPCCHSWRSCLASKAKSVCVKVLGFKVKKWFNEFKYIVKSIEKSFQWDFSWFFYIFCMLIRSLPLIRAKLFNIDIKTFVTQTRISKQQSRWRGSLSFGLQPAW